MPTLFSNAFDSGGWLSAQVQAAAAVTVTYARGAETATITTAVVGRTAYKSELERPGWVEVGDRDYLIPADDLTAANATWATPAVGDRISETVDGTTLVFEVVTPDTGEPAWRYSDPQNTVWRIHVKRQKHAEQ